MQGVREEVESEQGRGQLSKVWLLNQKHLAECLTSYSTSLSLRCCLLKTKVIVTPLPQGGGSGDGGWKRGGREEERGWREEEGGTRRGRWGPSDWEKGTSSESGRN